MSDQFLSSFPYFLVILRDPSFSCWFYHSGSPENIKDHLPKQGVNGHAFVNGEALGSELGKQLMIDQTHGIVREPAAENDRIYT